MGPSFRLTSPHTQYAMLVDLLSHCNFQLLYEKPCCLFHNNLRCLREICDKYRTAECYQNFYENISMQCGYCDVLLTAQECDSFEEDPKCYFCGEMLHGSAL